MQIDNHYPIYEKFLDENIDLNRSATFDEPSPNLYKFLALFQNKFIENFNVQVKLLKPYNFFCILIFNFILKLIF